MKLFRPRFEQDPRWQRDNWAALHRKEISVCVNRLRREVGRMPGILPSDTECETEALFLR
jgi:hypothetical protein